jgi:transcription elongation factor GreA
MQRLPMTIEGAEALEEELQRLKTVKSDRAFPKPLPRLANMAISRKMPNITPPARIRALSRARIADIEGKLSAVQIIDIRSIPYTGKVVFGSTVTIINVDTDESKTYRIVGDDEADIRQGRISAGLTDCSRVAWQNAG